MTRHIHGFHDPGGENLHGGKPGWTLFTEEVGTDPRARGADYAATAAGKMGLGIIVRLNHGYGSKGTIPQPNLYDEFAQACASFVESSTGQVDYWVIGNEPNHEGERPNGMVITPEDYCRCYDLCYEAIKRVRPQAQIVPAAMAPYHAAPMNWLHYAKAVYHTLARTSDYQAVNMHAYTRSDRPEDILSTAMMGGVLEGTYSGFWTFKDFLGIAVPASKMNVPALLTEFNIIPGPWPNANTGVIRAMYAYLDRWNNTPGTQKIVAGICFRFQAGLNRPIDWGMSDKPELLQDFNMAAAMGYMAPSFAPDPPTEPTEPPPDPGTDPDPGLDPSRPGITEDFKVRTTHQGQSGIQYIRPQAGPHFILLEADYVPNGAEVFGPDHHILVDVRGTDGQRKFGQKVTFLTEGHPPQVKVIDKRDAAYGVDFPLFSAGYGYGVFVGTGDVSSDQASHMGLGTIDQPDWNHHVTYRLVFQERVGVPSTPQQPPQVPSTPASPANGAGTAKGVPRLVHPIVDPAQRIVSQEYGENPHIYGQYKIDGVPLQGHEGLDIAAALGSEVQAVDKGIVTEVGDQGDKGYGKWVKVAHEWGETVYAHLQEQWVKVGDEVDQGDLLGAVGYTGNVSPKGPAGTHLHFGMRVKPYNRQDGWGGYVDPVPYLKPGMTVPAPDEGSKSRTELVGIVKQAAQEFNVDWRLLASLIHAESSFNPQSRNPDSGAAGLGNIMPGTWAEWAPKVGASNIHDPEDNARVTAAYLAWCLGLVNGDQRRALWAYNWSPKAVWAWAQDKTKPLAPPAETQQYASKVLHGKEVLEITGA